MTLMPRRVIAIIGVVLIVGSLAACGASKPDSTNDSGVLRVGTEATYKPFSFQDPATGELVGYDVDVARAVGEKLGRRVEFVPTPWESIFAALEAKRFDLVANQVAITPERQARYDISDPYSVSEGVLVTRADETQIKTLDDVAGKSAGQTLTSNWGKLAAKSGARVVNIDDFAQSIKLLNQGRIDVVLNDSTAVYAYLAETGDTSVRIAGTVGERTEQGFAARKESGLVPQVNKALDQLRSDGTLTAISNRYLKVDASASKTETSRTTWQLIRATLWPLAKAAITMTVPLTIISFILGLIIALIVALARMSSRRPIQAVARFYISVIRGTPLLVQLFIVFFALPELGITISPFPAAVIAFSLNVGGYAAEIIRSAITSIPKGQTEAAQTIGMSYATTLRRIILPQAARVAVPPLSNTLISLVKDTSLASTILVTELLRTAQIAAAPTFQFFAMYATAAAYYWVICLVLSFGQNKLETRLERHMAQ